MPTKSVNANNYLWQHPGTYTPASLALVLKMSDTAAGKVLREFVAANPDQGYRLNGTTYIIGHPAADGPTGNGMADLKALQRAAEPQPPMPPPAPPFTEPDPGPAYGNPYELPPPSIVSTHRTFQGRDGST